MHLSFFARFSSALPRLKREAAVVLGCGLLTLLAAAAVWAQAIPDEAYGPYNITSLPDGPGVIKPLAPPPPLDPRYDGPQPPDPLTQGSAPWTLAFWFRSSDPLDGTVLLGGFGDPTAADARFIGVENHRLGLWLGTVENSTHLLTGSANLAEGDWHFAAAVSDGHRVTLYADGRSVGSWPLMQGTIAAQIQIAPDPAAEQPRDGAVSTGSPCDALRRTDRGTQNLSRSGRRGSATGDVRCPARLWASFLRGSLAALGRPDQGAGRHE